MPAEQRGQPFAVKGGYGLRYYDLEGRRRRFTPSPPFLTKTAARAHYRDVIGPKLHGLPVARPDMTLAELVDTFLDRHEAVRSPRTIRTLRERLRRPVTLYGSTTLHDLERMSGDLADFAAKLPAGYRYAVMSALRQALAAGVRWGYLTSNPAALAGVNPMPPARPIRVYTLDELDSLETELGSTWGPIVPFAAATGLRPAEWARLERRDIDRTGRVITVRGTKTTGSRREVPLSGRALAALEKLSPRLDTPLVFPGVKGGVLDLDNFRLREWKPAVEAAGVDKPARIYDLRSTFASNALAAGVVPFELAKIMGTSIAMLERSYGALIAGAREGIAARLDEIEHRLGQEKAAAGDRK